MNEIEGNSRKRVAAGIGLIALATAVILMLANEGGSSGSDSPASSAVGSPRVEARFAVLAAATSNRCDLGAAELRRMPDDMRLQGSCCSPMNRERYGAQRRELRPYDRRLVPDDPYDVSVAMAKRLLGYRDIALDGRQRSAYRRATKISELGGPCCCPCWRWDAFEGQARFLLARREFSAAEIAELWEAEEGCGGSDTHT